MFFDIERDLLYVSLGKQSLHKDWGMHDINSLNKVVPADDTDDLKAKSTAVEEL